MEKKQKGNNAAQHFFFYTVSFLALAFLVFGWGGIVFQFINKFFPDPLVFAYQGLYDQDAVKFGIASIFVAAPIFFLLTNLIVKQLRKGEILEDSKVRRWLIYIVLFVTAAVAIGDLIAVLFSFLNGEFTGRFVLKALTILFLALAIFGYYFWDVRKKDMVHKVYPLNAEVLYLSLTAVVVVFGTAFFLIDKPSVAREKKIDTQTISDLENVDNSLRGYFDQKGMLPEDLTEMKKTNFAIKLSENSSVEYQKTGEESFNLCANFKRSNLADFEAISSKPAGFVGNTWEHEADRVCFERIVIKSETGQLPAIKEVQ